MKKKMIKYGIPIVLVTIAFAVLLFSLAVMKRPILPGAGLEYNEIMNENNAEIQIKKEIQNVPTSSVLTLYELENSGGIIEIGSSEASSIVLDLSSSNILHASIIIRDKYPPWDVDIAIELTLKEPSEILKRNIYSNSISVLSLLLPEGANNNLIDLCTYEVSKLHAICSNGDDKVICVNAKQSIILGKGGNDVITNATSSISTFKSIIFGGTGNDIISSFYTKLGDFLYGGPGSDILKGNWGKNTFNSSSEQDVSIGQKFDVFGGPAKKVIVDETTKIEEFYF